jgi:hypothetical protein
LFKSWKSRAAVFSVAVTMAAPVLGIASPAGAGPKGVPFKGSVSCTVSGSVFTSEAGTGNASHLGKISYSTSTGILTFDETLTAANGDTLTLRDVRTVVSGTEASGTWTVIGGTGRFAGATGSGTSDSIRPGDGTCTQTWSGSIVY